MTSDEYTDGTERKRVCPHCDWEDIEQVENSKKKRCTHCGSHFYGTKLRFVEPDTEKEVNND